MTGRGIHWILHVGNSSCDLNPYGEFFGMYLLELSFSGDSLLATGLLNRSTPSGPTACFAQIADLLSGKKCLAVAKPSGICSDGWLKFPHSLNKHT